MRAQVLILTALLAAACAGPTAAQEPAESGAKEVGATMRGFTVRAAVGPLETPLPIPLADFLLDHPDLSAFIVRRHKIAPYSIAMRGPRQSWADDGDGTAGLITLIERKGDTRVYYGEGSHKSRIFPTIRATAVIVMNVRPVDKPGCPQRILSSFDVYVRLRNPVLSGFVKALRPFLKGTIIRKFSKAFLVAHDVGRLLARDPGSVASDVAAFPELREQDRPVALGLISELKREPASCP